MFAWQALGMEMVISILKQRQQNSDQVILGSLQQQRNGNHGILSAIWLSKTDLKFTLEKASRKHCLSSERFELVPGPMKRASSNPKKV